MKGISIAMETIVYLILAVTVLSVALFFFMSQANPAQDQFTLEANRNRFCGIYTTNDFQCKGDGVNPLPVGKDNDVLEGIGSACGELHRRSFGHYPSCSGSASLECIKECCMTCP